jgi:tetratricopeptide (TPR) repeat protein
MIDRALRRNPSSMQAHAFGAVINLFEGRWQKTIDLGEEALRLNPLDPNRFNALTAVGAAKGLLEDLTGAEAALREALQVKPNHLPAQAWLTRTLIRLDRTEEARQAAAELMASHPDFRISRYRERWPFRFNQEVADTYAAALRTAGLPE